MTRTTAELVRPSRSFDPARPMIPVLIEVPTLIVVTPRPRPAAHRPSRRRRLRREVRLVGATLAFALPLSWALLTFWPSRPEPAMASAEGARPDPEPASTRLALRSDAPPAVTISLEASAVAQPHEDARPAVLPSGYLLPDDDVEEPFHEGR